jgi:hypothetical protein
LKNLCTARISASRAEKSSDEELVSSDNSRPDGKTSSSFQVFSRTGSEVSAAHAVKKREKKFMVKFFITTILSPLRRIQNSK